MKVTEASDDSVLLRALGDASSRFPFRCHEVKRIIARTRYNVIAQIIIGEAGNSQSYVLKTSLRPQDSYFLYPVWAKKTQSKCKQMLGEYLEPTLVVWGHGVGGVPTYMFVQPYVQGRELKEFALRELLQADQDLLRRLSALCGRIITLFLRTGILVDVSGSYVRERSWVKQKLKNIWLNFSFLRTTNIMVEDATNNVFIVDTDFPEPLSSIRKTESYRHKAKILVMLAGVVASRMTFDTLRVIRLLLTALGVRLREKPTIAETSSRD